MVTSFEFATAARIAFGNGRVAELPGLAQEFGARPLLVTGRDSTRVSPILDSLRQRNFVTTLFAVAGEPTVALAESGAALAREERCGSVIAIGGGSVIDAGKAIAALATNRQPVMEYLEVIGQARPLTNAPLPVIAIPTTAGTGAEVTRNAVLHSTEHRVKVSLRSALLLPRLALVDPELTRALPPPLTASTGLDALTQLIEPFVGQRANAMTDALCRDGIPRIARSLRRACSGGDNGEARDDMALASLFGGLALANAGLGAVHGFAAPIGGMFSAPHGAVCAALLPHVMAFNIHCARRQNATPTLRRYDEVARLLLGRPGASADEGADWVRELCLDLKIPRLHSFAIQRADFDDIAGKAMTSSSMKGNPLALTRPELIEVLEQAF